MEQIIALVLKEVKEEFDKIYYEGENGITDKFGHPPKSAVIKYHDRYDDRGEKIGNIIAAWRIDQNEIKEIYDLDIVPIRNPIDHMFYNEGQFLFSISEEKNSVVIEWVVGPRYGRGFKFDIEDMYGTTILKNRKLLWVS